MNRNSIVRVLVLGLTLLAISFNCHAATQTQCTPGITYWSLLESVEIGYRSGTLNLGRLYALCLPAPSKSSSSAYQYDPDGGGKLTSAVKTADGKVLNTYVWYGRSFDTLWELSRYKVIGGYESIKPLGVGNYILEFAAEDKPFYRFPFSVTETKADDPFEPAGSRYFIDGAWNEYGNIYFQRNDPASALRFTTWLRDRSGHVSKDLVPTEVKLMSLKDGKVFGIATDAYGLEPSWAKIDFLFHPEGDRNAYLKAGELLREDGKYKVSVAVNGKPYGDYHFAVKEGKIQLQGRQLRESTPPMDMIVDYMSGGRYTSWWIKREKTTVK